MCEKKKISLTRNVEFVALDHFIEFFSEKSVLQIHGAAKELRNLTRNFFCEMNVRGGPIPILEQY